LLVAYIIIIIIYESDWTLNISTKKRSEVLNELKIMMCKEKLIFLQVGIPAELYNYFYGSIYE